MQYLPKQTGVLVTFLSLLPALVMAQNTEADSIIMQLQAIHAAVANAACLVHNTPVISNRAMNVFLADKTGYLSESTDLSFYTNYLTLNMAEGRVTIHHNFQKPTGGDKAIRKLPCMGIWGSLSGRYAATALDKRYETEMGITMGYKWLGKVKTRGTDCMGPNLEKKAMDALRTSIVYTLAGEIKRRSADFETSLRQVTAADVPGQNTDSAKAWMRSYFYDHLKTEYAAEFAKRQAALLTETKNFTLITTGWTGITASIPLLLPRYTVGTSLLSALEEKHPFAFNVQLSHTWLWESSRAGRLCLQLGSEAFLNNSKWSYALLPVTPSQYKALGGSDTNHLAEMPDKFLYIGKYQSNITFALKGQLVYFPPASHIGIYFSAEQYTGRFHPFNSVIGIPVVLINSKKIPAVNFNFSILFKDMMNSLPAMQKINHTSFCISAGIPFSRLMF